MNKISIIVPSYKPGEKIFKSLDSFVNQRTSIPYEIIVVDSSPSDLHNRLQLCYSGINVIHSKKQLFPGQARNLGIKQATGDGLIFIDADIIAEENLVDNIATLMDKGLNVIGTSIGVANPFNLIGWSQYLIEMHEFFPESPKGLRASLPTGCIAIKKEIIDKFGGFADERIYNEDFLFTTKLSKNGVELYFHPEIKVKHFNKTNLFSVIKTLYMIGFGGALTRRKYELPGNFIIKYPGFILFSGLYKFVSIFIKLIKSSFSKSLIYVIVSPLVIINLCAFTLGFLRGRFASVEYLDKV